MLGEDVDGKFREMRKGWKIPVLVTEFCHARD